MLGPRGSFTTADYMVLVLVLVLSGAIGAFFAYKSRKSLCNKEFLVGNRKLQVGYSDEDGAREGETYHPRGVADQKGNPNLSALVIDLVVKYSCLKRESRLRFLEERLPPQFGEDVVKAYMNEKRDLEVPLDIANRIKEHRDLNRSVIYCKGSLW